MTSHLRLYYILTWLKLHKIANHVLQVGVSNYGVYHIQCGIEAKAFSKLMHK